MIIRNHWTNQVAVNQVLVLAAQVKSLENKLDLYEDRLDTISNHVEKPAKIASDSLIFEIKGRDSAIFSHGQQVRWLQWHVERLNKLNNQ